jgi:hypothetical protein
MKNTIKYAILRADCNMDGCFSIATLAINKELILTSIDLSPESGNDKTKELEQTARTTAKALSAPLLFSSLYLEEIQEAQRELYGGCGLCDQDTFDGIQHHPDTLFECAEFLSSWTNEFDKDDDEDEDKNKSSAPDYNDDNELPLINTYKSQSNLSDLSPAEIIHHLEKEYSSELLMHYWHFDHIEELLIAAGCSPSTTNFEKFKDEMQTWLGTPEHFQKFAINYIFEHRQPSWELF